MPITNFEALEKQWKLAEQINRELAPQLLKKAEELGVTIIQIQDSLELGGPLEQANKLLAWMKRTLEERLLDE